MNVNRKIRIEANKTLDIRMNANYNGSTIKIRMKANVQMRINTICKLLQNEVVKSFCQALLVKGFFENNISSLLSCNSEGTFKKILLYLENYMSCMI